MNKTKLFYILTSAFYLLFCFPNNLTADINRGSMGNSVGILSKEKKFIVITFPKCGSSVLVKWGYAVSGLMDYYGLNINAPFYYSPRNPTSIYITQPKIKNTFFRDFGNCNRGWHSIFHDKKCSINLSNYPVGKYILDPSYKKYIVIRNIYDRLITYYVVSYQSCKKDLFSKGYLKSSSSEYSFRELINFVCDKGYFNHHICPYSSILDPIIKKHIDLFEIIDLRNLNKSMNSMCEDLHIDFLVSDVNIPNKNTQFGEIEYDKIYDIPKPKWNKGKPLRNKEYWFDKEMREKIEKFYQEDFRLFESFLEII